MQVMKHKGYSGSIEASLEDNCLHGEVLFISDLITYEGSTLKQLEKDFQKAVDAYLADCKKRDKEPNKPFSGTFNVRIDPTDHRSAAEAAVAAGISLNQWVANAIHQSLARGPAESTTQVNQTQLKTYQPLVGNAQRMIEIEGT